MLQVHLPPEQIRTQMSHWIHSRCTSSCALGTLTYISSLSRKLMRFFTIGFSGERLEAAESFSGDSVMAAIELRLLTETLLKVRTSGGGDASGIEVLGVLLGVMICTGFVSLVPLWNPGGRGFGDVVVFTLGRLLLVFTLHKGGGMQLILVGENRVRIYRGKKDRQKE